MAAGNDPRGQFAGYNFLPLHSDGSGLAAVEAEVVAACLIVSKLKPKWLRNANVIYSLLPVLPGIARDENEPESMCLIRRLVGDECANVSLLTALLDKAGIEDYDIGLINQFMRVRYLGLTFQQYAKEKVAAASLPDESLRRDDAMFWPSFMYAKSNGGMLRADASQAGLGRDGSIARSVLAAAEGSWVQLAAAFRRSPSGRHSPDENTIGILSLVSIRASGWEFGQRLWSDVFRLAGDSGGSSSQPPLPTRQPLHRVRVYKHYVYFLTMAALAARREKHVFGDDALADMFLAMDRGGVEATSGLLCQIIRAGFEAGLIDVSSALEQWQLHRERCGLAPPGFLHQYFAARGLPEIPAQLSSMLGLIQEPVHCPRLSGYISHQMRMLG
ncbi:hypothetical protein GGI04_005508 [Coemansia thaxteri]|nr:hypothetical protein GGI04_005508 [Coemansia thaxteri]